MIRGARGAIRRSGWFPVRLRSGRDDSLARLLARSSCEAHPGLRILRLRGAPETLGVQHGVLLRALDRGAPGGGRWRTGAGGRRWRRARMPRALEREWRGLRRVAAGPDDPWAPDLEEVCPGRGWPARAGLGLVVEGRAGGRDLLHLTLHAMPAGSDPEPLLFVRSPEAGLAHVGLGVPGGLGLLAGMNEAGLSASWLPGRTPGRGPTESRGAAWPLSVALRLVLEKARTLPEAARLVARAMPRPGGDRVLLASAETGQAVRLDLSGARHEVAPMRAGLLLAGGTAAGGEPGVGPDREPASPEEALARLLARLPVRPDPEGLLEVVRDPWPREGRGLLLTTPDTERHPGTPRPAVALLLQPGSGRLWVAAGQPGGVHAPWLCFDLGRGGIRRPEADLPGSGLLPCTEAVEAMLREDAPQAAAALREAGAREPDHAVVLLLDGLAGDPKALRQLVRILPDSPHARLARAWLGEAHAATSVRVPVPSICHPRAWLHPAGRRIRPGPG